VPEGGWITNAETAEITYWPKGGEMQPFPDGDTVDGYKTVDEVVDFINEVAQR
jgi:hypothetical protein